MSSVELTLPRLSLRSLDLGSRGLAVAHFAAALAVALAIEFTGGYPTQLAHLFYIPVIMASLLLSPRMSLAVAVFAALLVTPVIDVFHVIAGRDTFFTNAAPWDITPRGWSLRPIAFIAISCLGSRLSHERLARGAEAARTDAKTEELRALNRIDKMILSGAGEEQSIKEIARFVMDLTQARVAGIATSSFDRSRELTFRGFYRRESDYEFVHSQRIPYGEGVTGWALMHGRTTWTRDVFSDVRYMRLADIAREGGWRSSAAAAIVLDGEILGALVVAYAEPRDFSPDEIAAIERIADQSAVAISNARHRESLQRMALDTAMVLSSVIETRDAYTSEHCSRLVDYSELTARGLTLPEREVELIKLGAALHDVGKIIVPDSILRKPEKLTPEEYAVIKQHCYAGGQICKKVPFLQPVHGIVYHHHERFDGSGYPDGIAGQRIPIGSRIVSIVDAYDAMTSDRPYRNAIPHDAARDILRNGAGTQWDPELVDCFLRTLEERQRGLRAA